MKKVMNYRNKEKNEAEINITPMLDVVFIMLIFFIVTTSFSKESGISINRPTKQNMPTEKSVTAVIKISEAGQIAINQTSVDKSAIRAVITKLRAENPNLSTLIIPQTGASTGDLISVMDQVKQAKIEKISIATQTKS